MENPFKEIKEKENWTYRELALMAGISQSAVYHTVTGTREHPNVKLVETYAAKGYDRGKLRERYQQFRQERRKELLEV